MALISQPPGARSSFTGSPSNMTEDSISALLAPLKSDSATFSLETVHWITPVESLTTTKASFPEERVLYIHPLIFTDLADFPDNTSLIDV